MTRRELPMLLSGPLVLATMQGRKTVTRRPVKLQWHYPEEAKSGEVVADCITCSTLPEDDRGRVWCRFGDSRMPDGNGFPETVAEAVSPLGNVGDWLYVREPTEYRGSLPIARKMEVRHVADGAIRVVDWPERIKRPKAFGHRLANGAFKEAARVWLEVTGVAVERVQDITEQGARDEGFDSRADFLDCFRDIYGAAFIDQNGWNWVVSWPGGLLSTTGRPA